MCFCIFHKTRENKGPHSLGIEYVRLLSIFFIFKSDDLAMLPKQNIILSYKQ